MAELVKDPNHRTVAAEASGILQRFNEAGVLLPADIHIARGLAQNLGIEDENLEFLIAFTVRAVRAGSVCLNLDSLPTHPGDPRVSEWDVEPALWPAVEWPHLATQAAVIGNPVSAAESALILDEQRLYLRRYWDDETFVLQEISARMHQPVRELSAELEQLLENYFPGEESADQRSAARLAATSRLAIITGGPGSGKTTTLSRLLGVLLDAEPHLRIGLAAPTGKAAARMVEAIADSTQNATFPSEHAKKIQELKALTIHRFLRYSPHLGYRHNRENPLPYDVVIIDETSMVSLPLMARLLEAVSRKTTVIFVGDPHQLASVEIGAVFTDLVEGLQWQEPSPVGALQRIRRFGAEIGQLATATNAGKAQEAIEFLKAGGAEASPVGFLPAEDALAQILPTAQEMFTAAAEGDAQRALELQASMQVLCAHRAGLYGVRTWNEAIGRGVYGERQFARADWHPGQPIMITRNDYGMDLFNGDSGVVVNVDGRLVAAFDTAEGMRFVPISQLADVIAAYAVTVHRAQGSQFDRVYVVLPEEGSRILTRELFYTAITRARGLVRVVGTPQVVGAAIERQVQRASGLGARLLAQSS